VVRDRNCDVLAVANIGDGCDLGVCEREQQTVKQQQQRAKTMVEKLLMVVVLRVSVWLGRWMMDGR
jgi:hypothetical protein